MISSVATRSLSANGAPYNMGKAALEALAATLAKEVHGDGIFVNTGACHRHVAPARVGRPSQLCAGRA